MDKAILISFDAEEFDISLEYGQKISESEQMAVSAEGLAVVLDLLDRAEVVATFFCTANFALKQRQIMARLAQRHEVASHGFYHGQFEPRHLESSRAALESLTGRPVRGFRMARLGKVDDAALAAAGYAYDSSENPIYLPGRYNNLLKNRTAYMSGGLVKLPISATPLVRFPLFWLAFKNTPLAVMEAASAWTLAHDGYVNLFFHPWEFADLRAYRLPWFVNRRHGQALIDRLERYLRFLKARGTFTTMGEFAAAWRCMARASPAVKKVCEKPKSYEPRP